MIAVRVLLSARDTTLAATSEAPANEASFLLSNSCKNFADVHVVLYSSFFLYERYSSNYNLA